MSLVLRKLWRGYRLMLVPPVNDPIAVHRHMLTVMGRTALAYRLSMPVTILPGAQYWIVQLHNYAALSRWAGALGFATTVPRLDRAGPPRWIVDASIHGVAVHLVCDAGGVPCAA